MTRCYSTSTIKGLISSAQENGYDVIQVSEGSIGFGHLLLIAPRPGFYHFEIMEEYRNCWSSDHHLRRFTKISKRVSALVAAHNLEVK